MQNEEFFVKQLKNHPDLEMRVEFSEQLERALIRKAQNLKKLRQVVRYASFASGVAAIYLLTLWFVSPVSHMLKTARTPSSTIFNQNGSTLQELSKANGIFQTGPNPRVYVYSTHNRESFLPDLHESDPNQTFDKTINISLVGKRLLTDLEAKKVSGIQTTADYWTMGNLEDAYDFSRKTVQETLQKNPSVQMVFDVHRDSEPRDKTTVRIGGQTVGKINIIIGGSNPHSQANEAFAKQINDALERLYPNLSGGIWVKTASSYNTTYNQDLNPHAILFEIGGPYDSLEEEYRSADMLANAIALLIQD